MDRLYRRRHRLEPVGGLFHVGVETWRGEPRQLDDGTRVAAGDSILRLHLDGSAAAAGSAGGGSAAATGLRFARRFIPACQALARRLDEDAAWADVVAAHTISWISPYVAEHWGFEAERLADGWRTRLARWHMGNLLAVAAGSSGHRRPWPVALWISRRRLRESYGQGARRR